MTIKGVYYPISKTGSPPASHATSTITYKYKGDMTTSTHLCSQQGIPDVGIVHVARESLVVLNQFIVDFLQRVSVEVTPEASSDPLLEEELVVLGEGNGLWGDVSS